MKRTLLFLFCALMSTQMFSETLFGYLFPTLAYLERTSCHYMEGNEQNRTLNRLSFEDNMFEIDGNYYIEYNDMWLREDKEGKIFVYSEPAKKDLVLYDFTLEVGDTLTTLNIDMVPMTEGDPILPGVKPVVVDYPIYINGELSCAIDTLIVTDVSMVMMCDSNQYKKWTFSNGMEYMEYIGNLGADFFPIIRNPWEDVPTCCVEEHLVCASIYDRLVYLMDDEKRDLLNIDCPCTSWSNKWQWRTNTWNVLQFDGMAFEQTAQTWQYKLAHDTIIGGKEYTAVTRHWTAYDESAAEYVAAVRFAENKKAFIYYDNAEYLLYDFGYHEIGDTLEVFSGINNYEHFKTYKCVITDNYSTAGGIAEDTYVMDIIHPITGDTIPSALVWQEFVGSYSGFLHGGLLVPGNSNYQLLCAYKDNVLAYSVDNDAFTDNDTFIEYGCEYNAEQKPKDLFPTLWGLQRTGCTKTIGENENGIVWGSRSYLMQETQTTTIDGKQYIVFGDEYDRFALREENNKILLYSSILKKDLVLYDFTLEVGDSLPALYFEWRAHDTMHQWLYIGDIVDYNKDDDGTILPAETFVVTDISTITLLDGKEYKKWTFDNGMEYVEGIGSFGTSYAWNDFYQLITNGPLYSDVYSQHLVCASKNGQLLYQMDEAEMERLGTECLCEVETSYKDQWCNKWNVMWFDGMRFDETARTSQYRLGKDTIIGDYTYSKFTSRTSVRFTDDRKVYVYYEGFDDNDPYTPDLPTGEYLAYDFSAQVGDTLEVFSGIGTYSTYPCVVDDVQIDSETNLRTMTLHKICRIEDDGFFEEYDDMEMTWIEGVGSPEGFLISYRPCGWVGGGTYALLCAYQGDELKYTGSLYKRFGCDYKAGVVSDDLFPTLSGLQRTICREYCEQADNKTRIEQFTNLTTRTETGGPYLYYSPFLLREKDNKILIYSRTLNKDLVLYDFNLQVGDSLPMLYIDFFAKDDWIADRDMEIWCVVDYHKDLEGNILPADTLIVTDVSAITLLDGKEYKKWTFNNGMEYVEGIGSFGNRQWSGDFFQLIGNMDIPVSLHGEHLVCVSKNNKLLYQMDDTEMERLGTECLCEVETSYKSQWCDTWNVFVENGSVYPPHEETYRYQLAQDIVIGDYTYTAVVSKAINDALDAPHYVAAVRFTDDRKVYIYYDNAEYLLYDFNVQQGDELEVFAGINNYRFGIKTYKCIVTGVEQYACIGCPANITLHVPNHPDDFTEIYRRTQWQEGVGDVYSGFLNGVNSYVPVDGGGSVHLLCAYQGDELKYTGDLYEKYGCGDDAEQSPEDLFPTLWGLQQTICSGYYGEEGDEWASGLTGPSQEITMMDGKPYLQWGSWYLREENDKILVYSEIQKKDLVLYDFTLELGDTLTTLNLVTPEFLEYEGIVGIVDYPLSDYDYTYPIDTLVVTELSKETLLDGKEYTRWKFSDGTVYVEGIGSMSETFFHHIADHLPVPVSYLGSYLVCVSKNGKLLYQMDDAELERLGAECLCDYDRGPRKDNAKNGKIGGRPTPTQWNQLELDLREMENGNTILRAETFSYTLENDSIVANDKIFYQLARQSTKDTATTKSFVGALHFGKDEDNRVYFLRDGVEYVLYDFTAEPGDTVEIFAGINNYPQDSTYTHVVTGKDTIENGACRMILEVVFPEETSSVENAQKVWLAGLGSIDGIVHNAATRATKARSSDTQTSIMLCAWRDDNCLYTTNHPEYDTFGCVYNQDPTAIESPTSPSSYQKILREGKLMILHNGKIYNVLGVSVK